MKTNRMLQRIKSALERSIMAQDGSLVCQQLGALVLVQKDLISDLQREVATLRLNQRYNTRKAANGLVHGRTRAAKRA